MLAACSNIKPSTFAPPMAQADVATVILYRPTEMSNALYAPGININGEFKLYAKIGMQSRLLVNAGESVFEFQAEKKYAKLLPLTVKLSTGKNYYIRVNTSLKLNNSGNYRPYTRSFSFTLADESLAIKEIAQCCITKQEAISKKNTNSDDKKLETGFSVDKTQNPFSH